MFVTFSICDESQHSLATMLGALSATPDIVVFFLADIVVINIQTPRIKRKTQQRQTIFQP